MPASRGRAVSHGAGNIVGQRQKPDSAKNMLGPRYKHVTPPWTGGDDYYCCAEGNDPWQEACDVGMYHVYTLKLWTPCTLQPAVILRAECKYMTAKETSRLREPARSEQHLHLHLHPAPFCARKSQLRPHPPSLPHHNRCRCGCVQAFCSRQISPGPTQAVTLHEVGPSTLASLNDRVTGVKQQSHERKTFVRPTRESLSASHRDRFT